MGARLERLTCRDCESEFVLAKDGMKHTIVVYRLWSGLGSAVTSKQQMKVKRARW